MQVIEIHDGEGQAVASKAEVLQLAESSSSLIEIIKAWCFADKKNSLEIYYKESKEKKVPGIEITFKNRKGWIADLFFDWASLSESKEHSRPVTDFIDRPKFDKSYPSYSEYFKDAEFDQYVGFDRSDYYCDELGESLLTPEQAVKIALSYAIANGGSASFNLYEPPDYYKEEDIGAFEFLSARKIISVCLHYSTPEVVNRCRPGFGSGVYFEVP